MKLRWSFLFLFFLMFRFARQLSKKQNWNLKLLKLHPTLFCGTKPILFFKPTFSPSRKLESQHTFAEMHFAFHRLSPKPDQKSRQSNCWTTNPNNQAKLKPKIILKYQPLNKNRTLIQNLKWLTENVKLIESVNSSSSRTLWD